MLSDSEVGVLYHYVPCLSANGVMNSTGTSELGHILARKNVSFSSQTSSDKEVVVNSDQQNNGDMKPIQNFTAIPMTQALNYNLSRQGHLEKEHWNAFSRHSPVNVSMDGVPCILFWAKRITIKFKNQTQLDLTDEAFGQKATVDAGNSNCREESATLSLKFDDAQNPKGLDVRIKLLVKIGAVSLTLLEKPAGCVWAVFPKLCSVKHFCSMKIFIRVPIKGILWSNVFEKHYPPCVPFGASPCKLVYEGFCEDAS